MRTTKIVRIACGVGAGLLVGCMPSGVRWYVILVVVLTIVATVAAMLEDD